MIEVEETFQCLCCRDVFFLYQIVLRHVLQQKCIGLKYAFDARQYITIDQFQSTYTKCIVKCKTKLDTIYNGNAGYQHKTPLSSLRLQRCEWLLPKDQSSITQILDIIEEDNDKCKIPFVNSFDQQNELVNSMVKLPVNSEDTTNQESDPGGGQIQQFMVAYVN